VNLKQEKALSLNMLPAQTSKYSLSVEGEYQKHRSELSTIN